MKCATEISEMKGKKTRAAFLPLTLSLSLRQAITQTAETQMDYCTEKSIGDFIDEPLKSSLKQNKLFTSQLESNGLMTVVSAFTDDKRDYPTHSGP